MSLPSLSGLDLGSSSSVDGSTFFKTSDSFPATIAPLPQFVTLLAGSGIRGPMYFSSLCLDQRGVILGRGKQFTVFKDWTVLKGKNTVKGNIGIMDDVVIKRVNADLVSHPSASIELEHRRKGHLRTLRLEVLALSHQSVQIHPNITKCLFWGFDYATRDRRMALPVLVMEKALGSLEDLLKHPNDYGADDVSFAVRYQLCLDVLEGLVCLHDAQFVHGDVKPANVLIFRSDDPLVPFVAKLNDFGLCTALQEDVAESYGAYGGTRGWLAPELMEDHKMTRPFHKELLYKCDVFAFGLLAFSVLFSSGDSPYEQAEWPRDPVETALRVLKSQSAGKGLVPDLTSKLKDLISTSLDADPENRPILHRDLLAINIPQFHDWLTVHERLTAIRDPTSHLHLAQTGSRRNGLNHATFWSKLDLQLLEDLKNHIPPGSDQKQQQVLPGEAYFGMGACVASHRQPGFQMEYAQYVIYAANALLPAAAGIGVRILEALDFDNRESRDTRLGWLREAVSTGSLTAVEDTARLYPEHLAEAKQAFRNRGGYNDMSRAEGESSSAELFDMTIESASQLCNSLGAADFTLDKRGRCLLHYAALYGNSRVIEYLVLEQGAYVNTQDHQDETPLYNACLSGDEAAVRTLLQLNADANIVSKPYNISCLHWLFNFDTNAIRDVARLLIARGQADVGAIVKTTTVEKVKQHIEMQHFPFHWPFGTPLHWAIAARSPVAADVLLEFGADIDAFDFSEDDEDRQTALTMAMYRHDAEMVEYLLKNGASSNYIDSKGRNLVHIMAANHSGLYRAFRLPRSIWSWASHGPAENHLAQLKRCLLAVRKSGVNLDLQRVRSQTPLIDAIENEDACAALVLLEAGANPDILCPTGESILQRWLAVDARRLDYPDMYIRVLSELLNRTNNIDHYDRIAGETVCHYAAASRCSNEQFEQVMSLLLARDPAPSLDARDRYGVTPFLSVLGNLETENISTRAKSLVRRGADTGLKTNDGQNFLHCLCSNHKLSDQETLEIAKSLLARFPSSQQRQIGSDSHSQRDGSTALMKAVQTGKIECVKLLASLGVNINALDMKNRRTALDLALSVADNVRTSFIESSLDSLGTAERADAIDDRTAFELEFNSHKFPEVGSDNLTEKKYFNAPAIIAFLESLGAKRAKDVIQDPGKVQNPLLTDIDLIEFSEDRYVPSKQPFLELWTHLYQLAWDEHKHTSHPGCACCSILKELPSQLRDQPFTTTLLEEISKFQPSFKEVEDLLTKS